MSSALVGVLLLGVAGLLVLKRLRRGARPAGATALATLHQTLRLSPRQAVHAIEFDDRILLVGEHERGLVLLDRGRTGSADDEAAVLGRGALTAADLAAAVDADDDGAVPRDLVIPRPPHGPRSPAPAVGTAPRATRLNDFRSLLQKASR
jgi:hypothetical protein